PARRRVARVRLSRHGALLIGGEVPAHSAGRAGHPHGSPRRVLRGHDAFANAGRSTRAARVGRARVCGAAVRPRATAGARPSVATTVSAGPDRASVRPDPDPAPPLPPGSPT